MDVNDNAGNQTPRGVLGVFREQTRSYTFSGDPRPVYACLTLINFFNSGRPSISKNTGPPTTR